MRKIHWLAGAAALAAIPASAQNLPTFDPDRIRQHVQVLSSDAFEGRAPATAGETKTVAYLIEQFRAAGLQPGGEVVNGLRQWTQKVPLLKSQIVGSPDLRLTIAGKPVQLRQGEEIAVLAPVNGATAVDFEKAPLVFAGYGVTALERNWDDFKDQDVRGKILVVLVNDPDFETGEGDFGGRAMTYYGRWTYKFEEAARRGAAGVMVVHETAPASYGWNVVQTSNTSARFDVVRQNPAEAHTPFESWIQRDLAARLFQASGTTLEKAKAAAQRRDFRPIPLNAAISADFRAETNVVNTQNVLGVIPGTTRPDETIIYTGHWDHLGIGKPDATGDAIYNGATDNSTGIAHLIEQARAFAAKPRPERSVVFLALGAEEKGLLGAEYYVSNPIYPLAKTVAVLNTDSMGTYGPARDFSMSGNAELELLDILVEEGQRQNRSFTPDPNPSAGLFYRSDHFAFAKRGVPAISFKPGLNLVNGGSERGMALAKDYVANRYHQPADEYSPDWDFTGITTDARLLHAVGWRLANSSAWPNWGTGSEFRSIRDETGTQRGAAPVQPSTGTVPVPPQPVAPGERG